MAACHLFNIGVPIQWGYTAGLMMRENSTTPNGRRIVLVSPRYPSSPFGGHSLPVGLGYLAEALLRHGIAYRIVDLDIADEKSLHNVIAEFEPQWLGISMMSLDVRRHYALATRIKERYPDLRLVAGGPHLSFVREEALRECASIDYAVIHEGERSLCELLDGGDPSRIPGVISRSGDGGTCYGGDRAFEVSLDDVPYPRYEGFDLAAYGDTMQIVSSRGCPFKCTFCFAHLSMGKHWRARSYSGVLEEILCWHSHGYRKFNFVDSNFFLSSERVIKLCEELKSLNLDVGVNADGMRAQDADESVLRRMKEVGLRRIAIGVESANDDVLVNVKKGETVADIARCLDICASLDIGVITFFIIGLPGETPRHVLRSFWFALRSPAICSVFFHKAVPLPGTELYDWAESNGYLRNTGDDIYDKIAGMGSSVLLETPEMSSRAASLLFWASRLLSHLVRLKYVLRHGFRK